MSNLREAKGYSLVTAILPRHNSTRVIDAVLAQGNRNILALNARGTLIKERWYQSFLPVMNPEQEVVQILTPESEVDHVMRQIVSSGRLQLAGAGAIYSIKCDNIAVSEGYPLWEEQDHETQLEEKTHLSFKKDLTGIFCIAEGQMTETIARAAVQTGGPGPTISYCLGRGIRDRLLLLRIAKSAEKEFIQTVVENCDADPVFNAMANAGRIDEPGRGFIYRVPIEKGLNNIASVFGMARHSASFQQIVASATAATSNRKPRTPAPAFASTANEASSNPCCHRARSAPSARPSKGPPQTMTSMSFASTRTRSQKG
jgi:nitrogen regulatory protein PII